MGLAKDFIVHASALRSASLNYDGVCKGKGLILLLDISAVTGTNPTLDIKLQRRTINAGSDGATLAVIDIPSASFAQKTSTGTLDLVVYPGLTGVANRVVTNVVAGPFRVVMAIAGTFTAGQGFTFHILGIEIP